MTENKLTEEEYESSCDVSLSPPRSGKWRANISYLGPIEGDETHSHAVDITEHLVDRDVVGSNPADP